MDLLIAPITLILSTFILGILTATILYFKRKGDTGSLPLNQVRADYPFSHFSYLGPIDL